MTLMFSSTILTTRNDFLQSLLIICRKINGLKPHWNIFLWRTVFWWKDAPKLNWKKLCFSNLRESLSSFFAKSLQKIEENITYVGKKISRLSDIFPKANFPRAFSFKFSFSGMCYNPRFIWILSIKFCSGFRFTSSFSPFSSTFLGKKYSCLRKEIFLTLK